VSSRLDGWDIEFRGPVALSEKAKAALDEYRAATVLV